MISKFFVESDGTRNSGCPADTTAAGTEFFAPASLPNFEAMPRVGMHEHRGSRYGLAL